MESKNRNKVQAEASNLAGAQTNNKTRWKPDFYPNDSNWIFRTLARENESERVFLSPSLMQIFEDWGKQVVALIL